MVQCPTLEGMGTLTYAGATAYEMDDRTLAHLEAVIVAKLRRHEYLTLGWTIEAHEGSGRVHLSIHDGVPLELAYRHGERQRLNRKWIDALMEQANSPQGIMLMTEDEAMRAAGRDTPNAAVASS